MQLRLQAELPPGFTVLAVGPTTTQAFWQVMTCVSQVTEQAVDVCGDINGVGASGAGWTCPGTGTCPGTACASRMLSDARPVEMSKVASRIESCRTYLIEASLCAGQVPNLDTKIGHCKSIARACAGMARPAVSKLYRYSITSSAVASSDAGRARPSILAVWTLMTSSSFVACTTGRSAGFAPLRIRPA